MLCYLERSECVLIKCVASGSDAISVSVKREELLVCQWFTMFLTATKAKVLEDDRLSSFSIHLHPSKSLTNKIFELGML